MLRFLPVTHNALLVELADLDQTLALLASLQRHPPHGVEELVPAARTILVEYRASATRAETLVQDIAARSLTQGAERSDTLIEIPVHYNGEDLAEVAQILGITPEEVVRRHTGSEFTVAFTGFAPGFAYLSGGDPVLNVPRRSTPRTRLPAGSVGLAGTFSGVYPQASPGGWQIIGTTPVAMWDITRAQPALLQPGYRVRFVDIATKTIAASAYSESAAGRFHSQSAVGGSEASQGAGLVLYPHFQHQVVPGWLDKALRWRHKATPALDSMVVLSPDPQWVKTLPNAKLPDRQDFTHYGPDTAARSKAWLAATGAAQQLADELAQWLQRPDMGVVHRL